MIFAPDLCEKILAGEKTVTRRRVKYDDQGRALPCRYKVGKVYAIQPGRGKKAVGRMRVTLVSPYPGEPLGRLSDLQAALEGFQFILGDGDPVAFEDYWRRLYGSYNPRTMVWRIEFELVEASP